MILSKKIWWALNLTWGLSMTLVGLIVGAVLLCCGYKPYKNMYGWYFIVGKGWGGFNMGPISIVSENPSRHTLNHEFGHSIHNCYFGPFLWFFVVIPSVSRYWYREYLVRVRGKKYSDLPPYDDTWFEGTATTFGNRYYEKLEGSAV